MIQIDLWGMLCIMGIPAAATGLFVWLLQRWISKKEKKREELEGKREKLQLQLVRSVNASITLGEATAKETAPVGKFGVMKPVIDIAQDPPALTWEKWSEPEEPSENDPISGDELLTMFEEVL